MINQYWWIIHFPGGKERKQRKSKDCCHWEWDFPSYSFWIVIEWVECIDADSLRTTFPLQIKWRVIWMMMILNFVCTFNPKLFNFVKTRSLFQSFSFPLFSDFFLPHTIACTPFTVIQEAPRSLKKERTRWSTRVEGTEYFHFNLIFLIFNFQFCVCFIMDMTYW